MEEIEKLELVSTIGFAGTHLCRYGLFRYGMSNTSREPGSFTCACNYTAVDISYFRKNIV